MGSLEITGVSSQVQPLRLSATWWQNGVSSGVVLDYQFALKHHHFYDGGECYHQFDEVALWKCARELGNREFEDAWGEISRLFELGRAPEVDAWIEANCKTLASYYDAA